MAGNPEYKGKIQALIERDGALGVNALAKGLNIPLSTMQHYLTNQQSYFIKNEARKWDLPENIATKQLNTAQVNVTDILDINLKAIESYAEGLISQLKSTSAIIRAHRHEFSPVADKPAPLVPEVAALVEKIKKFEDGIKLTKKDIPEEFRELATNMNVAAYMIDKGMDYLMSPESSNEMGRFLLGHINEPSDELLEDLLKYQK